MANLTISDLQPAGLSLFSDSEDYLSDLSESEQDLQGGIWMVSIGMAMALAGGFGVGFAGAAIYYSGTKCGL
ncbi:hypothetical protein IFO70_35000 [Phormidium tenue FACHB-886]|nr:hypothetical protein [Phormidium tenue FACHB-886]